MVNITIKSNFTLRELSPAIKKSIIQSTLLVHGKAVINSPYKTGNLRRSLNFINKDDHGIVGTDVKYANRLEFVNKKNPHKKFYMKRAIESSSEEINNFFYKNILAYIVKLK